MADMEGKILTLNEEFTKLKEALIKDTPPKPAAKPNNVQEQSVVAPAAEHRSGGEDTHRLDAYGFSPLSPEDTSRAKKLLSFLNNSGLDRAKTKTVMIMDSNGNRIQNRQVDPDGGCKVIASGGLCIVSLVHALHEYESTHNNIKKVVHVVGTNDQLHSDQHKPGERINYIKALHSETLRIFPNAQVNIVLPFGGTKIDYTSIENLAKDITNADVDIRQYRGPNMRNKLSSDRLHMNPEGKSFFIEFLRARFIPKKANSFSASSGRINNPASGNSGRINSGSTIHYPQYPVNHNFPPVQSSLNYHPNQSSVSHAEPNSSSLHTSSPCFPQFPATKWSSVAQNSPPQQTSLETQVAETVARIMSTHRDRSGPSYPSNCPPYGSWPY